MAYKVSWKRKLERALRNLPDNAQDFFELLVEDLKETGPIQRGWSNFSALGPSRYHCHLSGSYVACWKHDKGDIQIEVYYVGSREDAPY